MADIIGTALLDFHSGKYTEDIRTHSSLGEDDSIPLPYLFRNCHQMPALEQKAIELSQGKVLDVGCGAGNHSLHLQKNGLDVTTLDSSKGAIAVCSKRGVTSMVHSSILEYSEAKFHTLLLMNGLGLAGNLDKLDGFLTHLKSLLLPDGQILVDSCDIIYMFDTDDDGGIWVPGNKKYYGEVTFWMEYKNQRTEVFDWLYLDFTTLKTACADLNFDCELVTRGKHYDYLAKLSPKEY